MSATSNGFSIRDYTYKMRSIDVYKCWPFSSSSSSSSHDLRSCLPPFSQSPLRSNLNHNHNQPQPQHSDDDDDESDKSDKSLPSPSPIPPPPQPVDANDDDDDDKLEMVCPVCREFNAATLTAVNAHIDACLAQTMRDDRRHIRVTNLKSKSKPPKKRSIAEIFRLHKKLEPHQNQQQQEEKEEEEDQKEQDQDQDDEEDEDEPQIKSALKSWRPSFNDDQDDPDDVSMTVTKFEWLTRRLEALRSNRGGCQSAKSDGGDDEDEEKSEMVCPVCRDFNAATVTAVNAHIDSCLAHAVRDERRQMKRTTKPKAPKKRSIAEILMVAPPIGTTTNNQVIELQKPNGSRDSSGGDASASAYAASDAIVSAIKSNRSTKKRNTKKKKKGKKKSKVDNNKHGDDGAFLNNNNNNTSNKKKKKKKKSKSFSKSKEDAYKSEVQTPAYSFRKPKGPIGNKMVALHNTDPSFHKKRLDSEILSEEPKKQDEDCDSVGKQLKEVSPAHGIRKNHLKQFSGKASSGCNSQDDAEESDCDELVPTSDKHVRFTGKDDPLGPKKRNSFETMFNKSSEAMGTSLVKEQWSGSDEETASLEANRNYDHIGINIENRKEVCPTAESKQFSHTPEQFSIQSSLKPCINQEESKYSEEKSVSLTKATFCDNDNLQLFDGGNTSTSNCSPYGDISRSLSTVEDVQMSGVNTDACESGSFSSIGKFIDHLENSTFHVAAVNSNANTRAYLEPSSSYSTSYDKSNERPQLPLQAYGDHDTGGQALGDRQFSHMFRADMIDKSFPFTGRTKGSVRTNCLDPNFFGLPLNSQGELINFSSSGKVGVNQPETPCTSRGSSSGLPANNILLRRSQENLSMNRRDVVQKTIPQDGIIPLPHYPARLAVTALQYKEREDIHRPNSDMCSTNHVRPLHSELNLMRSAYIEQNQSDQIHNHKTNGTISQNESSNHISPNSSQPTVRLMGKDVPIGRSSEEIQQYVGDVWADQESRRLHYSKYAALENSLPERCSKQDFVSSSPLQMPVENVLLSAKVQNYQASQHTVLMNGPETEFPLQFGDLQSNRVSQKGSLGVSRSASSHFHPMAQGPTSGTDFRWARDDFPEQLTPGAKPQGLGSRSQVLPSSRNYSQRTCLSNGELNDRNKNPHCTKSAFEFPFLQPAVDEQAKTFWFQRPYRSSPSWLSSSTDEKRLPVTFSQQVSGVSSHSFPKNVWGKNFTTPPENHSTEVPYPNNPLTSRGPVNAPLFAASIVQPRGCRNMTMVADRMKLDDMTTKDHHPCTNTRKRPAANFDDSRKPTKLPNIEVQENLSRKTRLTEENSSAELQRNTTVVELDPQVDSARSRSCQNEAQNLHATSYPAVDAFKLHGTVKSGPVRLGPGARHILRFS
ncbi:hypothetical protein RIF29_17931 [Crotalaria pallida]|uniref:UBZ4-type domain-containing protein n=1 Tax=Crotalaria pallida TaxID=3830 RepID=A0AAN9FJ05_CROPI